MFNTIDLFVGAGGITEGFKKAGFTCLCANDIDKEAQNTFCYNHRNIPFLLKDIKDVSANELLKIAQCAPNEVDVITGGPPCQGFSLAGQRLSNDPRNSLFREFVRIANDLHPKVIFFENVYGIMNMQKGEVLKAILFEFNKIGYKCKYELINAADYGVPQARPRFVLIGVLGEDKNISFPTPTHGSDRIQFSLIESSRKPYVTVKEALQDLPEVDQGEGEEELFFHPIKNNSFQIDRIGHREPGKIFNHRATKHSQKIQERY